uniref:Cas1p 10 TM acyl transferase domain-containing protein n=1 Tax=Trichobilharzia regenti TaxID=157069 RepID=A0AA85JPQ7_TRIRE|nr:unnamed protein product [Trichobilharzia regenti]
MSPARAASAIKEVINFKNAKRTSFLLMIIVSIYHGFLMTKSGGNLCKSLLSDGRSGPSGEFRPYSCMIHTYLSRDSRKCFKRLAPWADVVRLYFVGDSRLKKLFKAFAYHINDETSRENITSETGTTENVQYVSGEVDLRFFYHEEITEDTLDLFKSWIGSANLSYVTEPNVKSNKANHVSTPTHLVISLGTKTIQRYNQSENGLLDYMNGIKRLANVLEELKFARSVWMLQDPVAESLLSKELKIITNDLIDKYNEVASTAMKSVTGVEIWSSNRLIALKVGFPTINWNCRQLQTLSTSINHLDKINTVTSSLEYKDSTSSTNVCMDMPILSDGYHVSDKAMKENVQILLNLYCNNQMKFSDGTCCRGSEPITPVQEKCFIFYAICVLSTFLCFLYSQFFSRGKPWIQWKNFRRTIISVFYKRKNETTQPYIPVENNSLNTTGCHDNHGDNGHDMNNNNNNNNTNNNSGNNSNKDVDNNDNDDSNDKHKENTDSFFIEFYELTSALSKFGAIMVYFFICDRTILFMKANKGYTNMSFLLPIIYCFVLGLFFSGPTKRTKVNHLDITREWKGWMQLYLLIYHFTDSYRVTPIFMSARLVVSSYLFLSGYGHFSYFWRQSVPQISWLKLLNYHRCSREFCTAWKALWQILHRYLIVIYRFNFFVFGLCLIMNRGYLAYYFIPLVSFWFTVVLIVCVIFPRVSGQQISGNYKMHEADSSTPNNDITNNINNNNNSNNNNNIDNNSNRSDTMNTNSTTITLTSVSSTITTADNYMNNKCDDALTNIDNNRNYYYYNNSNNHTNDNHYYSSFHQYLPPVNHNQYLPNQFTESDDEVYFSKSSEKSSLLLLKPALVPPPSTSSSSPSSSVSSTSSTPPQNLRSTVAKNKIHCLPYSSPSTTTLRSSINYKGHQKALSLGTGFDLCQNYTNVVNANAYTGATSASSDNYHDPYNNNNNMPTSDRIGLLSHNDEISKRSVGHRLHRSMVKSRGRHGPPLTEDLMRKFQCIVIPLKKQTKHMHKKHIMLMNQKLRQPIESSKSWILYYLHSKLCIHCSRIRLVYLIMIIKFIILLCFIEVLYRSRECFNWLFFSGPQKYLFQYNHEQTTNTQNAVQHEEIVDNQQTWFYRWSMDRYSAIYGMIFAFVCESLRQIGVLKDGEEDYANSSIILPLHRNSCSSNSSRSSIGSNDNNNNNSSMHSNTNNTERGYVQKWETGNNSIYYNTTPPPTTTTDNYNKSSYCTRSNSLFNSQYTNHIKQEQSQQQSQQRRQTEEGEKGSRESRNTRQVDFNNSSVTSTTAATITVNNNNNNNGKYQMKNSCSLCEFLCKCFSSLGLTILGIFGLLFALIYVFACSNRETCLHIHAYVCLIPIISYILVRNSFSSFRRTYSIFFAWIGDMSLERRRQVFCLVVFLLKVILLFLCGRFSEYQSIYLRIIFPHVNSAMIGW